MVGGVICLLRSPHAHVRGGGHVCPCAAAANRLPRPHGDDHNKHQREPRPQLLVEYLARILAEGVKRLLLTAIGSKQEIVQKFQVGQIPERDDKGRNHPRPQHVANRAVDVFVCACVGRSGRLRCAGGEDRVKYPAQQEAERQRQEPAQPQPRHDILRQGKPQGNHPQAGGESGKQPAPMRQQGARMTPGSGQCP